MMALVMLMMMILKQQQQLIVTTLQLLHNCICYVCYKHSLICICSTFHMCVVLPMSLAFQLDSFVCLPYYCTYNLLSLWKHQLIVCLFTGLQIASTLSNCLHLYISLRSSRHCSSTSLNCTLCITFRMCCIPYFSYDHLNSKWKKRYLMWQWSMTCKYSTCCWVNFWEYFHKAKAI